MSHPTIPISLKSYPFKTSRDILVTFSLKNEVRPLANPVISIIIQLGLHHARHSAAIAAHIRLPAAPVSSRFVGTASSCGQEGKANGPYLRLIPFIYTSSIPSLIFHYIYVKKK